MRAPSRFQRGRITRWAGRALLLLAACEASLRVAAVLAPRLVVAGKNVDGAVVCIGDSNTFGVGAPKGRDYPRRLGELVAAAGDEVPVVNLGVAGQQSASAVDRLEEKLGDGRVRCVVFLAGINDLLHDYSPASPARAATGHFGSGRRVLRRSATWRMIEAGVAVARGDFDRAESGGQRRVVADPTQLDLSKWDSLYPAARANGIQGAFPWLARAWNREDPWHASIAWSDLSGMPGFDEFARSFRLPRENYEWELARLRGERRRPLEIPESPGFAREFARFTASTVALDESRSQEGAPAFLVGTAKLHDRAARQSALERVKRLGEPRTATLRWLVDHADADPAKVRAEIPLETIRASWIGPLGYFQPILKPRELAARLGSSCDRLASLAAANGFRVVVLTYLDFEHRTANNALRKQAERCGWPLVDMQKLHPDSELRAEDKQRYFCPDRTHPNEAGYELVARAVFDALRAEGIVASR